MSDWQIEFLAGAVLATMYLDRRFGGSAQNRSYTTAYRYFVGFAVLATVHLVVYYSFASALSFIGRELQARSLQDTPSGRDGGTPGSLVAGQSLVVMLLTAPSWMAVVTVYVLPRLGLSRVDGAIWRFCKRLAAIPDAMEDLRNRLLGSGLEVAPETLQEIYLNLRRRGQEFYRMKTGSDTSLGSLWSRASILMHHLALWQSGKADAAKSGRVRFVRNIPDRLSRGRYSRFMYNNKHRHESLRRRYDYITFKAGRIFDQIDRLGTLANEPAPAASVEGADEEWGSLHTLVEARVYEDKETRLAPVMSATRMMLSDLRHDMDAFMRDACGLVARGVLRCESTRRRREARLRQLGFEEAKEEHATRFDSMAYAFLVVVAVLFVGFSVGGTGTPDATPAFAVNLVTMIALQQLIAVACAVLPKVFFGFANVDLHGRKPYAFFVGAGMVAMAASFVLGIGFRFVRLPDWAETWAESVAKAPWLLMPAAIAAVTAVLVQDDMASRTLSARRERMRDAAILGPVLGVVCLVVQVLLRWIPEGAEVPWGVAQNMPIAMAVVMGAAIGWLVPYSFRVRLHELRPQRLRPAAESAKAEPSASAPVSSRG